MANALGPFTTLHRQTTLTRLVTVNSTSCPREGDKARTRWGERRMRRNEGRMPGLDGKGKRVGGNECEVKEGREIRDGEEREAKFKRDGGVQK